MRRILPPKAKHTPPKVYIIDKNPKLSIKELEEIASRILKANRVVKLGQK